MPFIEFSEVSKSFARHTGRLLLRSHMKALLMGAEKERFYALKDISFVISHGENVGIVGANGAGKSTLLSLVVGLSGPDKGRVNVVGTAAGLLDLGSGFHPDLTGRENLFLNASLLGLTRKRAAEIYDEVVEFSDIGDFIHQPLRTYS